MTGCSRSPYEYILCCCVLASGFSSMSRDSVSMSISIEWILLALTGHVIGLRPAVVNLLLSRLLSR